MKAKIFIYTDVSEKFCKGNLFLSSVYKSRKSFEKQNASDNFVPVAEYDLESILKHVGTDELYAYLQARLK